jgi:PAS domain S-box-containing protein
MEIESETERQLPGESTRPRSLGTGMNWTGKGSRQEAPPLSEAQEEFQKFFEPLRDAIVIVDDQGRISYWNPASEQIFGYNAQEVTGVELTIVIPDRYHTDFWKGLKALKERERDTAVLDMGRSEARRKNKNEFPVEFSVATTHIKGNFYAVGIIRDMTYRSRIEEMMRERLERYELMLDNSVDAIMLIDIDTQKFLEVNKAAESLYGYKREEFLDMMISEISEQHDKYDLSLKKPVEQSKVERNILLHRNKGGTVFSVESWSLSFMWKNHKLLCLTVRNIGCKGRSNKKLEPIPLNCSTV